MAFTANSLSKNVDFWKTVCDNDTIIDWVSNGVPIPFKTKPESFEIPNRILNKVQTAFIDSEINKLVDIGAISKVSYKPTCVSPIHCVPKKSGDFRLIVDLRFLNEQCDVPKFSNENIKSVCDIIETDDDLITVDLKNGFYHIGIQSEYKQYLGIKWKDNYYIWNVLPFGLSASPYFFHKILRPVVQYLRQKGLRIVFYVDDGILMSKIIECQKELLLRVLTDLGWYVNMEKSCLMPSKSAEYVGYIVHSTSSKKVPWIQVPLKRVKKLKYEIKRVLKTKRLTARKLASLAGQCISMTRVIVPGKLLLRNVYRLLATRKTWQDILLINKQAEADLQWWLEALDGWNGCHVKPKVIDMQITTDASSSGWGAFTGDLQAAGFWNKRMSFKPSNYREMMAILLALKSFKHMTKNKVVHILSDNITAIANINHLGSSHKELSELATAIWSEAYTNGTHLVCSHISGVNNTTADRLSRLPPKYEWELHPQLFRLLDHTWGPHTIDRFASLTTTKVKRYNSRFWDPLSEGVNALAQQNWQLENNYVNPPFALINKVLDVVTKQKCLATILTPIWKAQTWYTRLKKMSVAPPIKLPKRLATCLRQGHVIEPMKNKKWRMCAWRISGLKV